MGKAVALQRLFADNIGSRVVSGIATMLLNGPVSRTIINGIAASPFAHLFLDAVSGAAAVVGPIETNMLVCIFLRSLGLSRTVGLTLSSTGTHMKTPLDVHTLSVVR